MSILQIKSGMGGCGASAVSWAFAREISAVAAFDFSHHQGGLAWASGADCDVSWPRIQAAEMSAHQLLEVSRSFAGIRLCSGGAPPEQSLIAATCASISSSQHIVLDGGTRVSGALELLVIPNQLRALKEYQGYAGNVLCLVGPLGAPPSIVAATLDSASLIFLRHESIVAKSLSLGFGVPQTKGLKRALRACLETLGVS